MTETNWWSFCVSSTRFLKTGEVWNNDEHPARPLTSAIANITENVRYVIKNDCRLGVRARAEMVNLDRELYTKMIFTKMVPNKCYQLHKKNFDRKFILTFATHSERTAYVEFRSYLRCIWPRNKTIVHWKAPNSPWAKRSRMSRSKFTEMRIVVFDIHSVVMARQVSSGQTVNQHGYIETCINCLYKCEGNSQDFGETSRFFASGRHAISQRCL